MMNDATKHQQHNNDSTRNYELPQDKEDDLSSDVISDFDDDELLSRHLEFGAVGVPPSKLIPPVIVQPVVAIEEDQLVAQLQQEEIHNNDEADFLSISDYNKLSFDTFKERNLTIELVAKGMRLISLYN
jgi:hypothetical protein